ncbi:MAG: RTX toxin, partial [Rhodobacteraceae bacterium]|nr:RTX toxin [Paracoccaceae bacterium]
MSSAIDFAVRGFAGGTQYGQVAGPDQSTFIQTAAGDSLSLNLDPTSVLGYTRDGADLVIELADGRIITLADWFHADGDVPNRLYLSTNGAITEVALTDPGDGFLAASFIPAPPAEKWSPLDDLRFTQ